MRPTLLLGGLVGVLVVAAGTRAQSPPAPGTLTEMTITVDSVEVRCGGTKDFYATSKLSQGNKVQVVERSTKYQGWYAIKPPPNSFSWINAKYVKRDPSNKYIGIVQCGNNNEPSAPVLAGSSEFKEKPSVEVAKLKTGTGLVVKGEQAADDGTWLSIQPTEQEVRYIPEEAVRGSAVTPVTANRPPTPAGAALPSAIQQAETAFVAHDWLRAKQLYEEAANQTSNYGEKSYCYNRLDQIETTLRAAAASRPATGQLTALYNTPPAPATGPQWSVWGKLRRTQYQIERRPVYALEDSKGQLLYASTLANLTLEPYVGQLVCLWGQVSYRSEDSFRNNLMTVSQVALTKDSKAAGSR